MATKRLDQYKGRLTPAQIADGMNAAGANAKRLVDVASLLLEKEDYPLVASIATLSIQESGKVSILRSLAVARTVKYLLESPRYKWRLLYKGVISQRTDLVVV